MSKVAIITDSISCIPANLVKEYDIKIIPVGLVIDGRCYLDTEITNEQFWKLFNATRAPVTTTAAGPGDFVNIFTELAKSTDSICCILVSKALSATHESACLAGEMMKQQSPALKIEVVDSKTASGAQGFIVLEAARAAQQGKDLLEVARAAREMIPRVKFLVTLETLKYVIRSGRAPRTAVLGDMLKVKPILGMVSGTGLVENLGRGRGIRKAMGKMLDMAIDYIDTKKPVHLMVHYTDDVAVGEELRNMVTSRLNCCEVYLTPYTPVMASQTGPVVAMAFYS